MVLGSRAFVQRSCDANFFSKRAGTRHRWIAAGERFLALCEPGAEMQYRAGCDWSNACMLMNMHRNMVCRQRFAY